MTKRRFLGTFNEPTAPATPQPPAPAPAPPAPAPAPTAGGGPDYSVILADMRRKNEEMAKELAAAKEAAKRIEDEAKAKADEGRSALEKEVARLTKTVNESRVEAQQARLQAYLSQRIASLRAQGVGFVEALLGGASEAEIEQSIIVATNEYKTIVDAERQKLEAEFKAKAAPTGTVGAPAAPPAGAGAPSPGVPPAPPAQPDPLSDPVFLAELQRNPELYAKHRTELLARLGRQNPASVVGGAGPIFPSQYQQRQPASPMTGMVYPTPGQPNGAPQPAAGGDGLAEAQAAVQRMRARQGG